MIKIAVDGNEANVVNRVGSNAYAFQLLRALHACLESRKDVKITVLLSQPPMADFPPQSEHWDYQVFGPKPFWTQWALPWYLFAHKNEFDVLFTPGHYAPRLSAVPYVSSVMDLAFLQFPKQFKKKDLLQLTEWTRYSVKRASHIIAISEFTKQDVVEHYKVAAKKISVAYPSFSKPDSAELSPKKLAPFLKKWEIREPYLVYVGTLQPRKNLEMLVAAFEEVVLKKNSPSTETEKKKKHSTSKSDPTDSLQLVLAGKVGWLAESLLKRIDQSPVKDRIILTDFVTEEEKWALYQGSLAEVLIGTYEGFGIPPLEAMAAGTIPIVSNSSSLPEVVGEAGIQVDCTDSSSIASGIVKVLKLSAKERATLLRKGRQQFQKFSWNTSAQTILSVLEKVAAKSKKQK